MNLTSSFLLEPGIGFHPVAKTHIAVTQHEPSCYVNLRYLLPPELFIDPYELANYRTHYQFQYNGSKNLELPVYALESSEPGELLLTLTEEAEGERKDFIEINVPLHLRYVEPLHESENITHRTIRLSPPEAFLSCELPSKHYIALPQNYEPVELYVSAGRHSNLAVVENMTAGVVVACFSYLAYSCWKTASRLNVSRKTV